MLLEITWTAHPVIFQVGWFALRWYALMFIVGFFIGIKIMEWIYRREGLDPERVYYLFLATFIGTIIGARLGHCFFYDPDYGPSGTTNASDGAMNSPTGAACVKFLYGDGNDHMAALGVSAGRM